MSVDRHNSLADATGASGALGVPGAQAALSDLLRPFVPQGFAPEFEVVSPGAMSAPARALLVHDAHMTIVLQQHFHQSVDVRVQEEHLDGEMYTRKIDLVLSGTTRVVEWGIARLNLAYLSAQVRAEILAKQAPLGAILIRHRVHRQVKPCRFLRFPASSRVIGLFGVRYNGDPVYGRMATIYCDNEPTVELLEIVVGIEPKETS